ncbi:hypothetical protein CBM2606_A30277 [Cupriavidus taiwanensis]|nr:hypothetical protein CBM2606_A30277 [Cupriavidus taiwanensis]
MRWCWAWRPGARARRARPAEGARLGTGRGGSPLRARYRWRVRFAPAGSVQQPGHHGHGGRGDHDRDCDQIRFARKKCHDPNVPINNQFLTYGCRDKTGQPPCRHTGTDRQSQRSETGCLLLLYTKTLSASSGAT